MDDTLLESVIKITRARNTKSLLTVLIHTLSDLITFDAMIFMHCSQDNGNLELSVSIPEHAYQNKLVQVSHKLDVIQFKPSESITHCIQNKEVVIEMFNGAEQCFFPVELNNKVIGILAIYGYQPNTNNPVQIGNFLRIYSNFLAVLDDNEHDTLTRLLNRKTFDACIFEFIAKAAPKENELGRDALERRSTHEDQHHWIGVLDIDHFKKINDHFGHNYGDEVLLHFASVMRKSFRRSDMLFRYGGEEFVVVLASTSENNALMVFERFRKNIELFDFPQVGRVTVSIGLTKIGAQEHQSTVVERADQALYFAKEHGRNQVCIYQRLIADGLLKQRIDNCEVELF